MEHGYDVYIDCDIFFVKRCAKYAWKTIVECGKLGKNKIPIKKIGIAY